MIFKYIHDFVTDVLFDIFRRVRVLVKKEASMNLLTDPLDRRLKLRSANVMVYEWVGENMHVWTSPGFHHSWDYEGFYGKIDIPKSCVK